MILQAYSAPRWCPMYVFARLTLAGCQMWWETSGKQKMRWIVITDISWVSWTLRLSIWGALAHKKGFLCMREDILSNEGKNWCTMAKCTGEKYEFSSVHRRRNHTLQTFQHSVLALYLDGSGSISCHTTLRAMSRVLKWGRLQHCRLLMNSAVCVVMLPNCGLRTCRKELFGSCC